MRRLRDPRRRERAPHRELVRHQLRGRAADTGQAEILGDGGHDRHGPIRRYREHAVDAVAAADLGDRGDVREVDDLRDVGRCETGRVLVPVDRDDAQAGPRACSIARRWWRPAPTKRTVFTGAIVIVRYETPPGGSSHGESRCQRPMWQPFSSRTTPTRVCRPPPRSREPSAAHRRSRCTPCSAAPERRASRRPRRASRTLVRDVGACRRAGSQRSVQRTRFELSRRQAST